MAVKPEATRMPVSAFGKASCLVETHSPERPICLWTRLVPHPTIQETDFDSGCDADCSGGCAKAVTGTHMHVESHRHLLFLIPVE